MVKWVKAHPDAIDVVSVTSHPCRQPGVPSHRAVTAAYMKTQGIPWTVLEDPGHTVEELYGVVSTPTTFFVAPDGHVVDAWYYAHEEGFEDALAKELTSARAPAAACKPHEIAAGPKMDFTVAGADNKRVAIGALADRPSIIHFWATWCQPCVQELPSLVRLRDKMEKEGPGR
jgi:peroxiredoxin